MKRSIKTIAIAAIYTVGIVALSSCSSAGDGQQDSSTEQEEQMGDHEHMEGEMENHEHMEGEMENHEGMEMSEAMEVTDCPKWENGVHDHATYVCPMWEEEGELEAAGDCPKCGMTLVAFADVKEQHDSQNPEDDGHDHEH